MGRWRGGASRASRAGGQSWAQVMSSLSSIMTARDTDGSPAPLTRHCKPSMLEVRNWSIGRYRHNPLQVLYSLSLTVQPFMDGEPTGACPQRYQPSQQPRSSSMLTQTGKGERDAANTLLAAGKHVGQLAAAAHEEGPLPPGCRAGLQHRLLAGRVAQQHVVQQARCPGHGRRPEPCQRGRQLSPKGPLSSSCNWRSCLYNHFPACLTMPHA